MGNVTALREWKDRLLGELAQAEVGLRSRTPAAEARYLNALREWDQVERQLYRAERQQA